MPRNDNKCNKFILIRTTKNFVLSGSMPKKRTYVIELVVSDTRIKAKLKPFDLYFCLCVSFHASMTIYHELQLFNPHSTLTQLLLLLLLHIMEELHNFLYACMFLSLDTLLFFVIFFHSIYNTHFLIVLLLLWIDAGYFFMTTIDEQQ